MGNPVFFTISTLGIVNFGGILGFGITGSMTLAIPLGKMIVVRYVYDAWGNIIKTSPDDIKDPFAKINPIRYRSYYYDIETGLYYLQTRYYNPEWCSWLNGDVSSLNPFSINGLNLYSYTNNDPISISYSSFSAGKNVSDGVASGGFTSDGNLFNNSAINGSFWKINWPKTNSVLMTNHSNSIVKNILIGLTIGNMSFTRTTQHNEAGTFYSYSNVGNLTSSVGIGFDINNWYGYDAYVSTNIGIGSNMQITPYITLGAEISILDGISFSFGTISGNVTNETTLSVGWGTLAGAYVVAGVMAATPMPGARIAAVGLALIILCIDIFK